MMVEVFGIDGRLVLKAPVVGSRLDLGGLVVGAYLLRFEDAAGGVAYGRVVKE